MNGEYAISFLKELLRIYSPSGKEEEIAGLLFDRMKRELGFKNVRMDSVNNVIGEVGSGRPRILLCGHMDTVPGQQPVKLQDGLLYGRGASDAKAALAAMVLAASRMNKRNDRGTLIVAAVVDEEGTGLGVRELLRHGIEADFAIFGEPSGIDQITIGYKGRVSIRISCETPSVHSSAPWMSQNAIEKLFEVWYAIKQNMPKSGQGDHYREVSACITKIRGGSAQNVVPGRCELTADIRVPPHMSCTKIMEDIRRIVDGFQSDLLFPKLKVFVEDFTEPFETDISSPLVRALVRAILKVRSKRPILVRKTGTGDMNILGHALKIPVVAYGPGNPHLSHTARECVSIEEYILSIDIIEQAVNELSTLSSVRGSSI
ncbi:MAG: M20/M25/M40 family metallo-hydrolase [Nitrososphaerota archaeon]